MTRKGLQLQHHFAIALPILPGTFKDISLFRKPFLQRVDPIHIPPLE
jgi:hypothetical protein